MARTYRNRGAVPHGFVVRDDGYVYNRKFPTKKLEREEERRRDREYREAGLRSPGRYPDLEWPDFRRCYCCKERKPWRQEHQRQFRARVRDRLAHEDWDNIPQFRRTGGWLTW